MKIKEKKYRVRFSPEGERQFPEWKNRKIYRIVSSRTRGLESAGCVRIQISKNKNRETVHRDFIIDLG